MSKTNLQNFLFCLDVTSKPGVTHGNVPQQEVGEEPEPEVHEELVDQTKRGLESKSLTKRDHETKDKNYLN